MKTYNLRSIMSTAWKLFRAGKGDFAECLRKAWSNAKAILKAKQEAGITEEAHTWAGWKTMGREVLHESVAVFQVIVADAKTKSGTRKLSYFIASQTQAVA